MRVVVKEREGERGSGSGEMKEGMGKRKREKRGEQENVANGKCRVMQMVLSSVFREEPEIILCRSC